MAKGEIVIREEFCKACGLCVKFCSRGCITMGENVSARGLPLPVFIDPERCNACCVCGWMCPDCAIEVYKYVEVKTPSAT